MKTLAVKPTYVLKRNTVSARRILENKLETKKLLNAAGIGVVPTLAVIEDEAGLRNMDWDSLPERFICKPNRGNRARGVLMIFGRNRHGWFSAKGPLTNETIIETIEHALAGGYSDGKADSVLIEPMLETSPGLKGFSPLGISDIQILCDHSIPIGAMLRVPTLQSQAISNLSKGGVGCAIDLLTATTTRAASLEGEIERHPDTSNTLIGKKIPNFGLLLSIARQAGPILGADNLAIEMALDKKLGAVVLEANTNPGVAIQVVCQQPIYVQNRQPQPAREQEKKERQRARGAEKCGHQTGREHYG